MKSIIISYSVFLAMIIFLMIRYMDVLERRKHLSNVVGVYNKKIESIDLPVIVVSKLTAVFQVWDWSYEGMIVDEEVREKIRIFLEVGQ